MVMKQSIKQMRFDFVTRVAIADAESSFTGAKGMNASDDNPGVIAPPPLLYAGVLGVGLALDILLLRTQIGMPGALRYGLAILLVMGGGALIVGAFRGFRRAGTNAEPWEPSTSLVTDGVYAFTRNPMYVAMALFYLAIAIAADSTIALLFLVPLLIVMHYGVVLREERYLEAKFGDPYRHYKHAVRRWI
jgi:protein-S-isoprenylcysteine O-methyltransferase Ste14